VYERTLLTNARFNERGDLNMAGRVRFRLGDSEVEVEGDPKFIDKYLNKFLDRLGGEGAASAVFKKTDLPSQIAAVAKAKRVPSPAEFYREKQPDTGTETLVVVAKFLEDYRSVSEFTAADVRKIAKEAKLKDIHAQYFTYAVKQGLLRTVGKGKYSLTLSGEDAVAAMPKKALAPKS